MNNNLNDKLYKRFGLELRIEKVQKGFLHYVRNLIDDKLEPIRYPDHYGESAKLYKIQRSIITEACREMFLDVKEYEDFHYGFEWFLDKLFKTDFDEVLIRLQILINLIHSESFINNELDQFVKELMNYLQDYPILGLTLKTYKTRPPQLLPSTSKEFGETIKDTLGVLDSSIEYKVVIDNYEDGLKEFLTANTKARLKDVVEDMYTSLDTLVQIITGNKKSGLRSLFVGRKLIDVGFNKWQFNIFNETKDWMDKIKHGVSKEFDKTDIETIILLVSRIIKTVIENRKS